MKTFYKTLLSTLIAVLPFSLTGCMDEHDDPDTGDFKVTGTIPVPTNYSIAQLKADHSSLFNERNAYEKVNEDLVLEGVIAANDVSGNLYQTLLIRDIKTEKDENGEEKTVSDQSIILGVRNTYLAPYFKLGQRIRINLKGLWIGTYSCTPKIGQPYKTSSGNWRLGPMLFELCRTNLELVGQPDLNARELVPIDRANDEGDAWLRASANKNGSNSPQLATVRGSIVEAQPDKADIADIGEVTGKKEPLPKIIAPDELHDMGYAVDRTIALQSNNSKVTLRTSTQNTISFTLLPAAPHTFTGIISYYGTDNWQLQLRTLNDLKEYK